jgi:hypothetical protein
MRLILTQCSSQKVGILLCHLSRAAPTAPRSGDRYEVVIDDWLDSGRSEQFACMASDTGLSRYEHVTKRHGEFSRLSEAPE